MRFIPLVRPLGYLSKGNKLSPSNIGQTKHVIENFVKPFHFVEVEEGGFGGDSGRVRSANFLEAGACASMVANARTKPGV